MPAQTVKGVAVGVEFNGPPLMFTITASVLEHVVVSEVAVKVKIVVVAKFTVVGSFIEALISCEEGDQLYVNGPVPVTVALIVVLVPFGIVVSVPAFTTGTAFTFTIVAAETKLWHPLALVT